MSSTYPSSVAKQSVVAGRTSWLERPLFSTITLNAELILFVVLITVGFLTRFYDLQARVMSHDENSHVYYSWLLYKGQGYSHDPITHGPLQFHLVALSYFLFGDNDFTARIPAALFSVAAIAFMWFYRRYLGRAGALVAGLLLLISPYMLFYGRYVRNEAFVAFFGVVTLWAILRYFETGGTRYLLILVAVTALHFATKETAFIYTAQVLIFLAFYLIYQLTRKPWVSKADRSAFLLSLITGLLLLAGAAGFYMLSRQGAALNAAETAAPAVPGQGTSSAAGAGLPSLPLVLVGLSLVVLLAGIFFLIRGYTWKGLRSERSFDMLIVLATMVLPMLAPFPVKAMGINPIDYNNTQGMMVSAGFVVILSVIAIALGLLWNPRLWLSSAALFYVIFTVFYTTVFTNGFGFVTGLVGSLGYWLEQQGVNRGNQPLYYYALIQVPVYEYLPAIGSLFALGLALFRNRALSASTEEGIEEEAALPAAQVEQVPEADPPEEAQAALRADLSYEKPPVLALLGYWAVTALVAYSFAGEKMPWLTVHITLPMILLSGWSIGYLIETTDWTAFRERRGWLVALLLPVFLVSFLAAVGSLLGAKPPFQGKDLEQLRATSTFLTALLVAAGSGAALFYLIQPWPVALFYRLLGLSFFSLLAVLTARTAFTAAYINYDYANELLVYAHSAPGVKIALNQIVEISRRTTDGLALPVAYDNETTYPYWWYLRDFTDQRYYGTDPTRSLRDVPVILVGDANYGKVETIVGDAYDRFDYIRLWWPNQDYFNLTWDRIVGALKDPAMRSALFQIWLNRNYQPYAQLTKEDLSRTNWSPSAHMRLYIRKDIVSKLWNYGTTPVPAEAFKDPYEGKQLQITPDKVFGAQGNAQGQFNQPRGIAVAPDGSLYVADTFNDRVQHLAPDGTVLQVWGSLADVAQGEAPGGTFKEPWGIAVAPDGSVFVADTWNHRIQKFTADGQFVKMWGYFGQAEKPDAFWGPRDVLVDSQGRVFVTDTGNKRVVVFDGDGNFITQFGGAGIDPGQFDEPVGLALDGQGHLYVADTWNQRIQSFAEKEKNTFTPLAAWDVSAWYGTSQDNKPYLAADQNGHLFATDPEGNRILEFSTDGTFIRYWGDLGAGPEMFNMPGGVAVDAQGGVWVTDVQQDRVMHFTLPAGK